jgi:hypothetical protein
MTSVVTTGMALPIVALFGFSYATDSHLGGINPMAATSIFIDGTKDIIPTSDPQDEDRMRKALNSAYDQCAGSTGDCAGNVYIDYPRGFGVLTGLTDPTYDESKAEAASETYDAITTALSQNPNDPVYVVGFSQGANAQSDVVDRLRAEGYDASKVTFVMVGNGARNDGGLWARLPAGVYVPFIGLSFGASTNPVLETDPYYQKAPKVILVSKQYDGASDVPKYVLNPVAWANAMMGFLYVHNGYYREVDLKEIDINGDGEIDQTEIAAADQEKYIITKTGNVTDIVIRNQPGDLPLTRPLLDLGVPRELVEAIDPLLRAIIETGYDRPENGGEYAATPVHLGLMPGLDQWFTDFVSIASAMKQTEENLEDLNQANLNQANLVQANTVQQAPGDPSQARTMQDTPETLGATTPPVNAPAELPPPASVPPSAPPPPPPPPAEELPPANPEGDAEILVDTTTKPKVPGSTGPNKYTPGDITRAVVGGVKTVVGAFLPKPNTTTAPSTPDPTSPDTTSSEPEPADSSSSDPGGTPSP